MEFYFCHEFACVGSYRCISICALMFYFGFPLLVNLAPHRALVSDRVCICVLVYLCICLFVYLCICVFVYLCICVFVYLHTSGLALVENDYLCICSHGKRPLCALVSMAIKGTAPYMLHIYNINIFLKVTAWMCRIFG